MFAAVERRELKQQQDTSWLRLHDARHDNRFGRIRRIGGERIATNVARCWPVLLEMTAGKRDRSPTVSVSPLRDLASLSWGTASSRRPRWVLATRFWLQWLLRHFQEFGECTPEWSVSCHFVTRLREGGSPEGPHTARGVFHGPFPRPQNLSPASHRRMSIKI